MLFRQLHFSIRQNPFDTRGAGDRIHLIIKDMEANAMKWTVIIIFMIYPLIIPNFLMLRYQKLTRLLFDNLCMIQRTLLPFITLQQCMACLLQQSCQPCEVKLKSKSVICFLLASPFNFTEHQWYLNVSKFRKAQTYIHCLN